MADHRKVERWRDRWSTDAAAVWRGVVQWLESWQGGNPDPADSTPWLGRPARHSARPLRDGEARQ